MRTTTVATAVLSAALVVTLCTEGAAGQPAPQFHVEVQFHGLIGWADDTTTMVRYALLVDAEYSELDNQLSKDDFPRCAWNEAGGNLNVLKNHYPRHKAHIRFINAAVFKHTTNPPTPLSDPARGEPLRGVELYLDGGTGIPVRDVAPVADRILVNQMRSVNVSADNFKLATGVLSKSLPDLDHVAARVSLTGGAVFTATHPCSALYPQDPQRFYSFKLLQEGPAQYDCSNEAGIPLVEETTWTTSVRGGKEYFEVFSGPPNNPTLLYTVKPVVPRYPLVIQILNSVEAAIDDPAYDGCRSMRHDLAFRWLYRLTKEYSPDCGNAGTLVTKQYYPCLAKGTLGGTKCPQIGLAP